MKYFYNTLDFKIEEPTVVTFGKFDGLHLGHELLMETLLEQKKKHGYKTVVFTFDIPPKPGASEDEKRVLTTNEEKHIIFEEKGIDYLIECPFTKEVMTMDPRKFIDWMVKALHMKCLVTGNDFHFGYQRTGDYLLLKEMSLVYGYEAIVKDKVQWQKREISSSYVREEIQKGNIHTANTLLGYDFFVRSKIVKGNQIGRTIGVPTINMLLPKQKLLPPNGVYVTEVDTEYGTFRGVTNVGYKPTISPDNPLGVETHILDFNHDLYGKEITVRFLDFIRQEKNFDNIGALSKQMKSDIEVARNYRKCSDKGEKHE